jgi:8-oxo-dGTP diphosphatase
MNIKKENIMDKRVSSRAIIFDNDKLLTMFRRRIKDDGTIKEYYVIPGGGLEKDETLEENVQREIFEELGIKIKILGYVGKEENETSLAHYFHCERIEGIPKVGGEELERMTESNYYEVRYVKLSDLNRTDINGKEMIQKAINNEYK